MVSGSKIRVLFIDDDGSIRIFAEALFNSHTFEIKLAENTVQADELLSKHTFDIIVCDVMMPQEDGIKYCNRLKKAGWSLPIVFLSAVSQPETVDMGLAAGAKAYFIKPFDARELQQQIIKLVGAPKSSTPPTKDSKKSSSWFKF